VTGLDWLTTYYWRVDEVNNTNPRSPWVGKVWSFTTADYGVVDNFEAYNEIAAGQPGSNLVYMTWLDGFANPNTNGSTMGYPTGSSLEPARVHGGSKAVPLIYNNATASFSEVERTFASQNWTSHGALSLSLWFNGSPTNVPGQLYVKINGVKVPYDGEAVNLTRQQWQVWNIPLASVGTNLQSVTKLAIGIETKGATGTLLLDDIRLYAASRQLITPVQPTRMVWWRTTRWRVTPTTSPERTMVHCPAVLSSPLARLAKPFSSTAWTTTWIAEQRRP